MDFATIELDAPTAEACAALHEFLDEHVTRELLEAEWRTGDMHTPELHRALGERGWLYPELPPTKGGIGLSEIGCRLFVMELAARGVPTTTKETTAIVMPAVRRWMRDDTRRDAILLAAARGEACFCLGYTEPEAGSDLAGVRTRAVRDGDGWMINGQKMFTTGAHNCAYVFLLTRTDPESARHHGLTTFLVPLDAAGVEIQPITTLAGERTNMVFFDDVAVDDALRLGEVGDGWAVVHGPLNAEHRMGEDGPRPVEEEEGEAGTGAAADMCAHILRVHEPAVRAAVAWAQTPDVRGARPIDDRVVRRRLAEAELGLVVSKVTPGPQGRVLAADQMIATTAALVDLVGPLALLTRDDDHCVEDGWVEYAHRFAQGAAVYGGTTEVMRNLIAGRFLGLGRPAKRA